MADQDSVKYDNDGLITLTADVVAAFVGNNVIAVNDVPTLIQNTFAAFTAINGGGSQQPEVQQELTPAVPIRRSVQPDYIICLEDGQRYKTLRRALKTRFNLTPEEYRKKGGLRP